VPANFTNLQGVKVTFAGLTGPGSYLNGNTYAVATILSTTQGIFTIGVSHAPYAYALDTGSGTTGNGTTGGGAPTFSGVEFAVTADGGQQWKCYGTAVENWGLASPAVNNITLTQLIGTRYWRPAHALGALYSILDNNQNIEVVSTAGTSGLVYPTFPGVSTSSILAQTTDGTAIWKNWGTIGSWAPTTLFGSPQIAGQFAVILDTNNNLQLVTAGNGGSSGGTVPVWNAATGGTTTDGALTWTNLGAGVKLTTAPISYSFSTHAIDGSVSTASQIVTIYGGILGPAIALGWGIITYIQLTAPFTPDPQIDQIWIWRTPQGQSTLILEDQIPVDGLAGVFSYNELGIPDTSANGGGALNAFIAAPVADQNDPPPAGMVAPVYHLERVWAAVGGRVVRSQGPDAVVGNGNTAFAPLSFNTPPAKPARLVAVTVQDGGLMVFTTSGIEIILGTGTASDPFYMTSYFHKVALAGYDALDVIGTQIYLMESNAKVSTIQVEYPFNPQTGYSEVGFPIGDQFMQVTTGGVNAALYNPATAFLTWNIANSKDTGMYVADGAVGWLRMGVINPPESGLVWSPRAAIAGGTSAVQSVETAPGVYTLLIGPAMSGPILMRDVTGAVWGDNGTSYPSWDAKGVNLLCSTGQTAEVAHISAKSAAVGARPIVSVLMGEIAPSLKRPWNLLAVTSTDPPDTRPSVSIYSDRYALAQNGVPDTGDCLLTKFDYGTQAVGDELLDWGIFASTDDERKEEAQNTGRG
jgi:hypothetical protein